MAKIGKFYFSRWRKLSNATKAVRLDQSSLAVNPTIPDSFICFASCWRQIGAFWSLRRDCTRQKERRMPLTVSKGRFTVFLSKIIWKISQITRTLEIEKKTIPWISLIPRFLSLLADRWEVKLALNFKMFKLQNTIEKRLLEVLTLFLWPLGLARSALIVKKSWNSWKLWQFFFIELFEYVCF